MGWLIFIDILLIIVLALMLSVTVNVHLNDETRIKIRYAGITIFSVSPEDEKHKSKRKARKNKRNRRTIKAITFLRITKNWCRMPKTLPIKQTAAAIYPKKARKRIKSEKKQITTATTAFYQSSV